MDDALPYQPGGYELSDAINFKAICHLTQC